jgi:hypothetical protein
MALFCTGVFTSVAVVLCVVETQVGDVPDSCGFFSTMFLLLNAEPHRWTEREC